MQMTIARRICPLLLALGSTMGAAGHTLSAFTAEDLVRLQRISDPQPSPNGRYVVFVLRLTDMAANEGRTHLVLIDRAAMTAPAHALAWNAANDWSPRWASDGRTLYFLSTRSGSSQVWRMSLADLQPYQVSDYPLDIGTFKLSPAGDRIAVSMDVLPQCADLKCTKDELDAVRAGGGSSGRPVGATGRIYSQLFVRHWDSWSDGTHAHLFVARLQGDGHAATPVDVSKLVNADVPSRPFGRDEEYAFSPDGTRIVFAARLASGSEPWSTNFDLYETPVDESAPSNLTQGNPAADTQPVFLKNGDMAYLAADRPGFEADRLHINLRDVRSGTLRSLTAQWDRSVARLEANADGTQLLATAADGGQEALFAIDRVSGIPHKIVATGTVEGFAATKDEVYFTWASLGAPADLYVTSLAGGTPRRLTGVNESLLEQRSLGGFEHFSFKGWNDETVYGYVVKPYGFAADKRFPVAFIVHGGPQGSFQNLWNYRWNAQAFAGHGYGVVLIDFHGSPGYGQAFTDSVSKDWGGKPLVDLQKGLAAAIERYSWLDGTRVCALGASYGGFMMNWIEGNWPDRFRCIVNHDGLFDQRISYYATEELWFPEWEFGAPYFADPRNYEQFNPANFVSHWHTPMLIIHGERDFRIPYSQGLAAFTALQRRGIESKLLVFPDENHWVLKPANSLQWHATVLGWLDQYLQN
jgi:dipeptidyl aminopeptidase/acylaminoacyl peptidase